MYQLPVAINSIIVKAIKFQESKNKLRINGIFFRDIFLIEFLNDKLLT